MTTVSVQVNGTTAEDKNLYNVMLRFSSLSVFQLPLAVSGKWICFMQIFCVPNTQCCIIPLMLVFLCCSDGRKSAQ